MGDITIQLRNDRPITTSNFKNLVQQGVYDGTIFHRVIADFMIQGGMNTSASVANIPDEVGSNNHNYKGTVAMAKTSQPDSATSNSSSTLRTTMKSYIKTAQNLMKPIQFSAR